MDLGASPGGWTYVMQSLGAKVTSVDKAKLDQKLQRFQITYLQQSAFAIDPILWSIIMIGFYPMSPVTQSVLCTYQ